jgi:hypothetical protein
MLPIKAYPRGGVHVFECYVESTSSIWVLLEPNLSIWVLCGIYFKYNTHLQAQVFDKYKA